MKLILFTACAIMVLIALASVATGIYIFKKHFKNNNKWQKGKTR